MYQERASCVQSALTVLCHAPLDQYAAVDESEVGKLLWEFMRTSMDCLQRISDNRQHTARVAGSRVRPAVLQLHSVGHEAPQTTNRHCTQRTLHVCMIE